MRLTNVAHLRLPFGRLMGYDVSVSRPGNPLPVSFDQQRHVRAGDRAGSWMALSFKLPETVPREHLERAWLSVIVRHGTLRSVFVHGDGITSEAGEIELREVDVSRGAWVEHPIAPGQAVNDAVREVLDRYCSPFDRPSHRMCVLETADGPTIVFGADHSHVDLWSMLVIARDFLTSLTAVTEGRDPELSPVPAFAEHTLALQRRPAAPDQVRRRWAEIMDGGGGAMPAFPSPLGEPGPQAERVEVRDVFDVETSTTFETVARATGVSTLSLAVSAMTAVTQEMADAPLRAIFPVHSRYETTWHDSVGWFITNSVLDSPDPDPVACAAAVKEAVRLGSWPLAPLLAPWGGMPESAGMFAISWLDLRRLPVRIDAVRLEAQYVGATIRTDGVMLWFVLDEQGLHLRCRYPDTLDARRSVGGWLDALVDRMRSGT